MKNTKNDRKNASDKLAGHVEVGAGKITGNEQMELKGHAKIAKADVRSKLDPTHKVDNMKEKAAGAINKKIKS